MRTGSPGGPPRSSRWWRWAVAGGASGLVLGFSLGLVRPRARTS